MAAGSRKGRRRGLRIDHVLKRVHPLSLEAAQASGGGEIDVVGDASGEEGAIAGSMNRVSEVNFGARERLDARLDLDQIVIFGGREVIAGGVGDGVGVFMGVAVAVDVGVFVAVAVGETNVIEPLTVEGVDGTAVVFSTDTTDSVRAEVPSE